MRFIRLLIVFFLYLALFLGTAEADIMNGSMGLDYSNFRSTTQEKAGNSIQNLNSTEFNQVYNLNLNLDPFPTFKIFGGLLFGKDATRSTINGVGSESSIDTLQPLVDVTLRDPFNIYFAEAGYSKRETTEREGRSAPQTLFNDEYHVNLGWTPLALPTISLPTFGVQVSRNNSYDQDRAIQDITTDMVRFSTHFAPGPGIDFGFGISTTDLKNKLNDFEFLTHTEDARGSYAHSFWNGRIQASTSYSVSLLTSETSQLGSGSVSFQRFPFAGLSAVTDTPTMETPAANALLIDGNLTASANINIGSSLPLAGDIRWREAALDFGSVTDVNNILVWVNQQLSADIANSFSWDIYTSTDNVNWTLIQAGVHGRFGPFVNSFSLNFSPVNTRYIKVATRPLPVTVPGAANLTNQNIYITELQAFMNKAAEQARGETRQLSQAYGVNVNTQIVRGLSHIFSYSVVENDLRADGTDMSSRQYTLSNGLNLTRVFNLRPGLTASGHLSRDDTMNSAGVREGAYNYSAVLNAVPFPTLRSSLMYGGRMADTGNDSRSLTLSSVAQLYQGISVNATAGTQTSISHTGVRSNGVNFLSSLGLAPRRDLSLSFTYVSTRSNSSGGDQLIPSSSYSDRYDVSITYRPFETLFLTSTTSKLVRSDARRSTLQNYGINWSPFLTGVLQLNFVYNESLETETDTVTKVYGPTVSWRIFPRGTLEMSYFEIRNDSVQATMEEKSFNARFKMVL